MVSSRRPEEGPDEKASAAAGASERTARLDAIIADYLDSWKAGTPPDRSKLISRHPDLAPEIGEFLTDQEFLLDLEHKVARQVVAEDERKFAFNRVTEGSFLGDYEILERISRAGMGAVYRARQKNLGRVVALKVIPSGEMATPDEIQRFRLEASAAAGLEHPNIVPVYDIGEVEGLYYFFSMRLVEGGSLARHTHRFRNDSRGSARLIETVARAVQHAHQRGILHRDLKPSNILLDRSGKPYVSDFGLAKQLDADASITDSGTAVGTPRYMAPEQAAGIKKLISTSVDVYSLGVILYELLTGRTPFEATSSVGILRRLMEEEPAPPGRFHHRLSRDLETICLKCLEKDPEQRYSSARALASDLRHYLDGEPIEALQVGPLIRVGKWAKRRPAVAALILVSVAALLALFGYNQSLHFAAEDALRAYKATDLLMDRGRYANRMRIASETENKNRVRLTKKFLWQSLPEPGKQDLRGFEWYHLFRKLHLDRWTLRFGEAREQCGGYGPVACFVGGNLVAVGHENGEIKLWSLLTGKPIRNLEPSFPHAVEWLCLSPDRRYLAAASPRSHLHVWDMEHPTHLWKYRFPDDSPPIVSMAFLPEKDLLALTVGQEIVFFGLPDGTVERQLPIPPCKQLEFLDGGREFVLLREDGDVSFHETAAGKRKPRPAALRGKFRRLALSPGEERLALLAMDGFRVDLWKLATGVLDAEIRLDSSGRSTKGQYVAFSRDGTALAVSTTDHTIQIWQNLEAPLDQPDRLLEGHEGTVCALSFSWGGSGIVSSSCDGTVKVWDLDRPPEPLSLPRHSHMVWELEVYEKGPYFVSASHDFVCTLWRLEEGGGVKSIETREFLDEPYRSGSLSPDGSMGATATMDHVLEIWKLPWHPTAGPENEPEARLEGHDAAILGCRFSPRDGKLLVSASADGKILLWRRDTAAGATGWQLLRTFSAPFRVRDFAFSPDGRLLAMGFNTERRFLLLDLARLRLLPAFDGRDGNVHALVFSPDSKLLAIGRSDGTVQFWRSSGGSQEPAELQEWGILEWHGGPIGALAFSSDGRTFVSGGLDGTVKVWDLVESPERGLALERASLTGFHGEVRVLRFTRDGKALIAGGGFFAPGKGEVKIWRAASDEEIARRYPALVQPSSSR